ncbi:MAG: hypothetical protein ACPH4D_02655 [Porticoccaceae bacterium]|jgi:hypothetical protein
MNINGATKIFGGLVLGATMVSIQVYSAEPEIDRDWDRYRVSLDFIDRDKRLIVASDREFLVPFNTPIYNSKQRPIAITNLQQGNNVWLYVDNAKPSNGLPEAKRIEQVK